MHPWNRSVWFLRMFHISTNEWRIFDATIWYFQSVGCHHHQAGIIINSLTQLGCDYILMIIHCPMQIFTQGRLPLKVDRVWCASSRRHSHDPAASGDVPSESRNGIMNDKQSQPPWVSEQLIRYIRMRGRVDWSSRLSIEIWLQINFQLVKAKFNSITSSSIRFTNRNHPRSQVEYAQIRGLIYEAMEIWQHNSNLKMREVREDTADILIDFARGNHGDHFNFNGAGGSLGELGQSLVVWQCSNNLIPQLTRSILEAGSVATFTWTTTRAGTSRMALKATSASSTLCCTS